jgi:hypothetical protein
MAVVLRLLGEAGEVDTLLARAEALWQTRKVDLFR